MVRHTKVNNNIDNNLSTLKNNHIIYIQRDHKVCGKNLPTKIGKTQCNRTPYEYVLATDI